jgi:phosphopantothenoylcysteine decarboxylase/phosphopantothenate--cysteine ligase
MQAAVDTALPADIAVMAAAVADWRVDRENPEKIKKNGGGAPALALLENPDILANLARDERRPTLLVGFAAETERLLTNAQSKLQRKGCDWIVANDVSPETGIMGGERNRVHLVTQAGVEDWPDMSKAEVAERLVARMAEWFAEPLRPPASRHEPSAHAAAPDAAPVSLDENEPLPSRNGSLDFRPVR